MIKTLALPIATLFRRRGYPMRDYWKLQGELRDEINRAKIFRYTMSWGGYELGTDANGMMMFLEPDRQIRKTAHRKRILHCHKENVAGIVFRRWSEDL